jgi:2-polyprenyl-6-methoxyphenol hydroxylase-like FAD-dependent oxidoreductase
LYSFSIESINRVANTARRRKDETNGSVDMKALIIGGGIGGMTAALSFHRIGVEVEVFESVAEVKPLGVGINILPHATRELSELGLEPKLAEVAIAQSRLAYHTKYGRLIWSEPRGIAAGYRWPQFSIHRGELQMVLFEAARERVGPEHIHSAHRLVDFDQDERGVSAQFVDPNGKSLGTWRGDALIGADGIHSRVRAKLYPNEGMPQYSGVTMWRGAHEGEPFLDGRTMIVAGNWNQKIVVYPISEAARRRGRSLINWVAEIRGIRPALLEREDWNRPGNKAEFMPTFATARFDFLDFPKLVAATERVFEFPMIDRDPLTRWSFGRVTLLGDAAHPMYPIGSNGGTQAIIDARALAAAFAGEREIERALKAYEAERLPPTAQVVLSNRQFGPEQVLRLVDVRCPGDVPNINDFVSLAEMDEVARRYKLIAGFDVETLNDRRSYDLPLRLDDANPNPSRARSH